MYREDEVLHDLLAVLFLKLHKLQIVMIFPYFRYLRANKFSTRNLVITIIKMVFSQRIKLYNTLRVRSE